MRENVDPAVLDAEHVLRPWQNFGNRSLPKVIERGEGIHIFDSTGKRYVDAVAGLWCTNIGLGRREMADAVAEQTLKLAYANAFVDQTNSPAARLAARIADIAPGDLNRVHFTTCGSTAMDTAARMVGFVQSCMGRPGKRGIVAREMSYHGSTYLAQSVGKRPGDRVPEFDYKEDNIWHVSAPYAYRAADGLSGSAFTDWLVAEFEDLIARVGADRIGGFVAEPIQASGGVLVPPDDYLRRMWEVCRRHDILFVADEVVTAFGRVGKWFASEGLYGVTPDIITVAKGLTSGYQPLAAVIFSDRVWDAMANDDSRWFTSGFTYAGHPVACASGLCNLDIMQRESLVEHADTVGVYLEERLSTLIDLPLVGDIRGRRLMQCIETVADKTTRTPLPVEAEATVRIARTCSDQGLIVRPLGQNVVMSPPLILSEETVDFIAETLRGAIRAAADGLVRDGFRVS
ncbi:MAG: aminotransferase [Pseudomonadota bacterium]